MIAVIGLLIGWFADHYSLQRKVDRAETKLKFLQSFDGGSTPPFELPELRNEK
jgi:hypothetical protein